MKENLLVNGVAFKAGFKMRSKYTDAPKSGPTGLQVNIMQDCVLVITLYRTDVRDNEEGEGNTVSQMEKGIFHRGMQLKCTSDTIFMCSYLLYRQSCVLACWFMMRSLLSYTIFIKRALGVKDDGGRAL